MEDLWMMNWTALASPAASKQQPLRCGFLDLVLFSMVGGGGGARIHNETTPAVSPVVGLALLCKGRRSN